MLVFRKKKEIPLVESLFYILENLNYLQLCIMVAAGNAKWLAFSKFYHIEGIEEAKDAAYAIHELIMSAE